MPNLLDYYTKVVTSTGVHRQLKVTSIGRPAADPRASETDQSRMKGKGQEDCRNFDY
jgi:hypothetical protein